MSLNNLFIKNGESKDDHSYREMAKELFDLIDKDANELVGVEELRAYFQSQKMTVGTTQLEKMVREADQTGKCAISKALQLHLRTLDDGREISLICIEES